MALPEGHGGPRFTGFCEDPRCFKRGFVLHLKTSKHRGDFHLDSLPEGRIDLLARVCTNAFFMSFGVRRNSVFASSMVPDTKVAVKASGYGSKQGDQSCPDAALAPMPRNADGEAEAKRLRMAEPDRGPEDATAPVGTVLCVDGNTVKHLRPDERNTASLVKRLLDPPVPNARKVADHAKRKGITVEEAQVELATRNSHCTAGMSHAAGGLCDAVSAAAAMVERGGQRPHVVLLHEKGEELSAVLDNLAAAGPVFPHGVVFVVGDNVGLTEREQLDLVAHLHAANLPFTTASLGAQPLLASQCVAIAHYLLDRHHVCTRST